MARSFPTTIALLMLLSASAFCREPEAKPTQYKVSFRVCEGDPLGSTEEGSLKVLSEPVLVTLAGREAKFLSGGELAVGEQSVPFGMQVGVRCKPVDGQTIRMNANLKLSNPAAEPAVSKIPYLNRQFRNVGNRPESEMAQMNTIEVIVSRDVHPGAVSKFRLGTPTKPEQQRWVEVKVEPYTE